MCEHAARHQAMGQPHIFPRENKLPRHHMTAAAGRQAPLSFLSTCRVAASFSLSFAAPATGNAWLGSHLLPGRPTLCPLPRGIPPPSQRWPAGASPPPPSTLGPFPHSVPPPPGWPRRPPDRRVAAAGGPPGGGRRPRPRPPPPADGPLGPGPRCVPVPPRTQRVLSERYVQGWRGVQTPLQLQTKWGPETLPREPKIKVFPQRK